MIDSGYALETLARKFSGWDDEKHLRRYQYGDREACIREFYQKRTGRPLYLEAPSSFNEKLQWLKCYWRDERAYLYADKWQVRSELSARGKGRFLVPAVGCWDSGADIPFEDLPNRCVLKATHSSGMNLFWNGDADMHRARVAEVFDDLLRKHPYALTYEWVYERIKPCILCEEIIVPRADGTCLDWKFYCFDGKVRAIHCLNATVPCQSGEPVQSFLTPDFEHIPVHYGFPSARTPPVKPADFDQMLAFAQELSTGFPHVRVDLLAGREQFYFGELTFFTGSGCDMFDPPEYDREMGAMLHLPMARAVRGNMTTGGKGND